MKSVPGLFLLFLFILPFTNAQTTQMLKNPDLYTFNINFIDGYAISYNYLTTDNFWLRAQLDLYTYGEDLKGDSNHFYRTINPGYYYGSRIERDQNSNSDYLEISFSTPILFPIYKSNLGFIYFGAGPKIAYTNQSYKSDGTEKSFSPDTISIPYIRQYSDETNNNYYDLGILVLFGLSAAITDNISIYAETHLSGGLRWSESNYNSKYIYDYNETSSTGTNTSEHGWFYDIRYVRVGVTISL